MIEIAPNTYASAPGDTLAETLEAKGMSQAELAKRIGLSEKTISLIIAGKEPISHESALALEKVFQVPARFWLNMESRYREALAREHEKTTLADQEEWARQFPYAEMAKLGWVTMSRKASEKVSQLHSFFAVKNTQQWDVTYQADLSELSYRKSSLASKQPKTPQKDKRHALSAWLRAGESAAESTETKDFCAKTFRKNLHLARALTTEPAQTFYPQLQALCAQAGVIYHVIPQLPGLGISGVMRWHRGRPMIQQSLLYKTNDSFWFTFFHEAKHVLQKRKKSVFLEGANAHPDDQDREAEADTFSRDLLVPPSDWQAFLHQCPNPSRRDIQSFANDQDIHPGIIFGRLCREKHLTYSHPARTLQVRFVMK